MEIFSIGRGECDEVYFMQLGKYLLNYYRAQAAIFSSAVLPMASFLFYFIHHVMLYNSNVVSSDKFDLEHSFIRKKS